MFIVIMSRLQNLWLCDLSTLSTYHAKILHTLILTFFFWFDLPLLRFFSYLCINLDTTCQLLTLALCKMVNLVNTLDWSRRIFSVNEKSHIIRHALTLQIFSAPKELLFWQNPEELLIQLTSANWAELHKSYM